MALWRTTVGKKVVMALTGVVLVGFVVGHMIGNLKIFLGEKAINDYAAFLREVGEPLLPYEALLWVARIVLLVSVALHIFAAIELTRQSWAARPVAYGEKQSIATSYAALTMRYGGVVIALFVVYHILHLTLGAVGFQSGQYQHLAVFSNVVAAFSVWYVSAFYIVAMAALCLHLDHGVWSLFQTLGLNSAEFSAGLRLFSRVLAAIVFAGFISVPVAVMAGWLR
jgi:succinate dehydrogenase / fumarate reductase cytochrome b subunit